MPPTILGSTVISQEQLVPGGYFLSGQLGVVISPWAFVILPPQNCWSETSRTHSVSTTITDDTRPAPCKLWIFFIPTFAILTEALCLIMSVPCYFASSYV